jgi:hypothetical protein
VTGVAEDSPRPTCQCRACGRKGPQLIGTSPQGTWCECPACRRIWHCDRCPQIGPRPVSADTTREFRERGSSWYWSI